MTAALFVLTFPFDFDTKNKKSRTHYQAENCQWDMIYSNVCVLKSLIIPFHHARVQVLSLAPSVFSNLTT